MSGVGRQGHGLVLGGVLSALLSACGGGGEAPRSMPADADEGVTLSARVRALAAGDVPAVIINEVHAANWQGARDEEGDAEDWVELHNPTAQTADLGLVGLSNKVASPFRWLIPAGTTLGPGQYLRVWLSKKDRAVAGRPLHASFNLDNGGETLYLSAPDAAGGAVRLDSASPPLTRPDVSWCRQPGGTSSAPFVHCTTPTPGAANAGESAPTLLAKPVMSLASGLYAAAQTVSLTGPAGAVIRYTLDGEEPGPASAVYGAPLALAGSTVLRAAAFPATPGAALSSFTETQTYVIDAAVDARHANQRVAFVTMRPGDVPLYNAKTKEVRFRTHLEILNGARALLFKADADSDVAGQNGSVDSPTTSLDVTLRDALGVKSLKTSLWPEKPGVTSVKKLRLRNGSNDWDRAHLRDQYAQSLAAGGPNLYASSTSVAMFLNGRYYGLMDLREKEGDTLVESNLGGDKDHVGYMHDPGLNEEENKGVPEAPAKFRAMTRYVLDNDMSVPALYEHAKTLLNPESLAHVYALHFNLVRGSTWPTRNTRAWYSPEIDGRWQWHPHDFDSSLGRGTNTLVEYDMYQQLQLPGAELFNALLRAPEFRTLFINVLCDQMNERLLPARSIARLDTMADEMRPYIAAYFAQAGLGNPARWEDEIEIIRVHRTHRPPFQDEQNRAFFGLSERRTVTLGVNDPAMGTIKVNTLDLSGVLTSAAAPWSGRYYPEAPITLEALPRPGFVFVGWQGASTSSQRRLVHALAADAGFTAQFAPLATVAGPVIAAPGTQLHSTGELVDLQLAATDPQGYPITWSAKRLPSGLNLFPATGKIYGKTTTPGVFATELTATNGRTASVATLSWTVKDRVFSGATASYWPNTSFSGPPTLVRNEALAMALGGGEAPAASLPTSRFAVRWASTLTATQTGVHRLQTVTSAGDGVRLYLDNQLLIDNWTNPSPTREAAVTLAAGQRYALRVEFFDAGGDAALALNWQLPGGNRFVPLTQAALGYPVNQAPALAAPAAQTSAPGATVRLALQGSDPEGTALTWSATGLPPEVVINPATGVIGGVTTRPGSYAVSVTARDALGAGTTVGFDWTVSPARLVNGSFEDPALADASFVIAPANVSAWSFTGSAALSSAGSAFTRRAPTFPDGRQVAALQNSGRIAQTVALQPGDVLTLQATQRVNYNLSPQRLGVYLDGVLQGAVLTPASGAWVAYRVPLAVAAAGSFTLEVRGQNTGAGVDSTAFVDALAVAAGTTGPLDIAASNGSFEAPVLGVGSFQYAPAAATGWSFFAGAGISGENSAFTTGTSAPPDGAQVGFLQRSGRVSQRLQLQPGDRLVFSATQRANFGTGAQTLAVFVDGVQQGPVLTPPGGAWAEQSVPLDVPAAGDFLVEIRGLTTAADQDRTAFIDQVRVRRAQ